MHRYIRLALTIACLLIPAVFADYPELMKAVQLNTGQPNWQHLTQGSNPNNGEQVTMDYYIDLSSIQNIATPWIAFRTLEIYTPYIHNPRSGTGTSGTKIGAITSVSLMNCQTISEVPIQIKEMAPDKTVISQTNLTEAYPKTAAPNSPSSQMMQSVCKLAYQLQPTPKFDATILPKIKTTNGPEWVAFAQSTKPDKTITVYYDKKSLIRKDTNLLAYTVKETYRPFSISSSGNKITSRVTSKITNCQIKQDAMLSRRYYGLNGKLLNTQQNSAYSLKANSPLSIDEAVRHDVCMYIDSLPITNDESKDK